MSSTSRTDSRTRFFFQLNACYVKGYRAGEMGALDSQNPYQPAPGANSIHGVQGQRRSAWERGRLRAINGQPLNDHNG